MSARFARGSRAWGECARSGKRMLLKDMVEDPRTGLLVAPDWAEPLDPRPPTDIYDGVALHRPAPDLDASQMATVFIFGTGFDLSSGEIMAPFLETYETTPPTITVT